MKPAVFGFLCLGFVVHPGTGKPLVIYSPGHVFAVPGQDVVLPCRDNLSVALSHHTPVEWTRIEGPSVVTVHVERGGEELVKEKDAAYLGRTKLLGDRSLRLLGVTWRDNGIYRCVLPTEPGTQASVSLIVGEVAEVSIRYQRMPENQMLVSCDCSSLNLELLMSLLDDRRNVLPAKTQSLVRPGGNYSISAQLHVTAGKGQKVVICRVEAPGASIVKEAKIHIPEELDHPDVDLRCSPGLLSNVSVFAMTVAFAVAFAVAVAVAVAVVVLVLPVPMIQTLRSSLQNRAAFPFRKQVGEEGEDRFTVYGDIHKVDTTGSSRQLNINGQELTGLPVSYELAKRDMRKMEPHTDKILRVANKLGVHPALIAAVISRQSKFGEMLLPSGFGQSDSNCFGLMQINKNYHAVKGNPYSEEHVDQGVTFLIQLIKTMTRNKQEWSKEQRLKGALACYIAGEEKVLPLTYEQLDSVTPGSDFASDVIARAQFFSEHIFGFRNT